MTEKQSGVYLIRNTVNGKVYVGSSINIAVRWRQHVNGLKACRHRSRHLQSAWDKYGEAAFAFSVLIICQAIDLLKHEQEQIDLYRAANRKHGYNTSPTAKNCLGCKRTSATKEKQSAMKTGDKHPNFGKHLSEETRQKIGAAVRGRRKSAEEREASRKSKLGTKHTPESIAKISAANTGSNNRMFGKCGEMSPCFGKVCTPETRAKISKANTGKVRSSEAKAKLAQYCGERHAHFGKRGELCHNFGRILTGEHKAKISAGIKASKLRKKALNGV